MVADVRLGDGVVLLRHPTVDDIPAIVDAVRASLPELSRWLPWATADYGPRGAQDWIDRIGVDGDVPLLVFDSDGEIAGGVGLNRLDGPNRVVNLGYWAVTRGAGRGLLTRASRLVAIHALTTMGLERVEIRMGVTNDRSRRVAERLGARHEGDLRQWLRLHDEQHDAALYSLVRDDLNRLRADAAA